MTPGFIGSLNDSVSHTKREREREEKRRGRGKAKSWIFVHEFPSIVEAEKQIKAANTWGVVKNQDTQEGKNRFYRCNKVPFKGEQCAAEARFIIEPNTGAVQLYYTTYKHTHDIIGQRKIPDAFTRKIEKIYIEDQCEKKRRGKSKSWIFVQDFPSIVEAEEQIKAKNTWTIVKKHDTLEGKNLYYRCNKVPARDFADNYFENLEEQKNRRKRKKWMFQYKFSSIAEAEEQVNAEKTWAVSNTHYTKEGQKRFYRCNKVPSRGPQCATQICLLCEADSDAVILYRTDCDHTHDSIKTNYNYGISSETKNEIKKLYGLHCNFIRNQRGQVLYMYNGYTYGLHRRKPTMAPRKNRTWERWRCTMEKSRKCRAYINVDECGLVYKVFEEHSHPLPNLHIDDTPDTPLPQIVST
ncbi:FLYWCH zinc finger domain-containing protein [Phthorimaea operculella]|nr:FLYWCH zinc finger domain-containing protein [Phthorimaea operculella]